MNYNLAAWEKRIILRALKNYKFNRTHAAIALGVHIRTLRNKIVEYRKSGMDISDFERLPSVKGKNRIQIFLESKFKTVSERFCYLVDIIEMDVPQAGNILGLTQDESTAMYDRNFRAVRKTKTVR